MAQHDPLARLADELEKLYLFRDYYFEEHPVEAAPDRPRLLSQRMNEVIEKFEEIDENSLTGELRAKYLYMKGRAYNMNTKYDPRASQALSKAVKLNPRLVDAWNELGECYWKNFNIKEAKSSFEGALKTARTKVTLRCLSIIIRQESTNDPGEPSERKKIIENSVELAKEAVSLDIKDGLSWSVLGNAYLCLFFVVAQEPGILKLCMSAYKQAELDPIARGQPDLYYNKGVALKYCEHYAEALESFERATSLDPKWEPPASESKKLLTYLTQANDLIKTRGKLKAKKIQQMAQSIDKKMLGRYGQLEFVFSKTKEKLTWCPLDELREGPNNDKVVLGRVIGSIHSENVVPFTFAMVDENKTCVGVTVYNWADGRGVIIGDSVAVPAPHVKSHSVRSGDSVYEYKSIRVDNPMHLVVNSKQINQVQIAGVKITSTYELQ